jgi:DNA-directed RNA polymerase specialized sigma24 family protein
MNQFTLTDCAFLNMKYSLGYNYDEIGTEFNISSNTVSNRVNYLKTKAKISADGDVNLDE